MINIEITNTDVYNFNNAIRGMRNALQSWDKSDSKMHFDDLDLDQWDWEFVIGDNDLELALKLCKAGSDHRKFLRQIFVSVDISSPWYWFKEYATYKIGTVENSTSMMHCLTNRLLTKDDFEWDGYTYWRSLTLEHLNDLIEIYNQSEDKEEKNAVWRELIQDMPGSFIYTRTCSLNYEVLRNMYHSRKNHKLVEWHQFCEWIEELPYSELITVK